MAVSLSEAANIAEIIGAGSIVTALVVAWIQIRYYRIEQRNAIASELTRTFYSPELAEAISLIQALPDETTLAELRMLGDKHMNAAILVTTSFETIGLLVFRGIAPFDLVNDLVGGIVSSMNRKLAVVQQELRVEQKQPSWAEWFEWLGLQVAKRKIAVEPAHIRYANWNP